MTTCVFILTGRRCCRNCQCA